MSKVPSTNEVTGDRLVTKAATDAYSKGWDAIFKKKPEEAKKILLINKAMCDNCHKVVRSVHTHDYVSCKCGNLSVDGGLSYCKRSYGPSGYTELSYYVDEDDITTIREFFSWSSYGKSGKEPRKEIALKHLEDEHIRAILDTQWHIKGTQVEKFFMLELEYRKKLSTSKEKK